MSAHCPDRFEEWLRAPVLLRSTDPRFEARRALPSEFDAVYNLVDEALGTSRPRAFYEWLYRRNPRGTARCWIIVERASGEMVATGAEWPWPIAHGEERLEGTQSGDVAVTPRWQRQGVIALRRQAKWSHPWFRTSVTLSWPNELVLGSHKKSGIGEAMGPVPGLLLPLKSRGLLAESGWPRAVATAAGLAADAVFASRRLVGLGFAATARIEEIRRFDSTVDPLTRKCMFSDWFWCPHDAEFLNWRYLSHPTNEYQAFAVVSDEGVVGYSVVRIAGERAWLMEMVAPSPEVAAPLLRRAVSIARDAGCDRLKFCSTGSAPHRRLLDSTGFLRRPSRLFLLLEGMEGPDIQRLDHWQCLPGDTDFL